MRPSNYLLTVLFIFLGIGTCYCTCADLDGDGVAETCAGGPVVPEASGPTPVYSYDSDSSSSSASSVAAASRVVHHAAAPSTESMVQSAVIGTLAGSVFSMLLSEPSGPTPEELEAQRKEQERLAIEAEKKRQAFKESNARLKGKLKKPATYELSKDIGITDGSGLKKLPAASASSAPAVSSNNASSGDVHRNFFGSGPSANPKVDLLREGDVKPFTPLSTAGYLTQADREHIAINKISRPHDPNDWMVDPEALVEAEHYSDPYRDVAVAAGKAAGKVLLTGARDEAIKKVAGENIPSDDLMSIPEAKKYKTKNNAEKFFQWVDYALTKAPSWTVLIDAGVNAVGAGVREVIIINRASKDKYHRAPKKFAKEEWDKDHKYMGDWGKAATDRVGAGQYNEGESGE